MILIRRAAESFHKDSYYDDYEKLNNSVKELVSLEEEITAMRETVSEIMYTAISSITDQTSILKAKEIRRKAFHRVNFIYDTAVFEQYFEKNSDLINMLHCDIDKRKRLKECYSETQILQDSLNKAVKEKLEMLCNDSVFEDRLYIVNPSLYSIIKQFGSPTRKSHYVTLLKYVYKQETCCTPSSLWSGVALCGEVPKLTSEIFGDYNRTRIKHEFRNRIIDGWSQHTEDLTVFVNPTMMKDGIYYLMFQFLPEAINKIRLRSNEFLDILYAVYRKKMFNIRELAEKYPIFESPVLLELIKCDILRIECPFPYGESGLQKISFVQGSREFDNYNIRFQNTSISNSIQERIIHDANTAFSTYKRIYDTFFEQLYFGADYVSLKNYLIETGKQSVLQFLYSDFSFSIQNNQSGRRSRTWSAPNSRKTLFESFCSQLKAQCRNVAFGEPLLLKLSDFNDLLTKKTGNQEENIEVVFQYDEKSSCVIPEMLSLTIGKFIGRYGRFFPELEAELYEEILIPDNIQVNIEINSSKDNISYDNPFCKARIILYDMDRKCQKNSETVYTLEDVFIKVVNEKIVLCTSDDKPININCASTLSPSSSKVYQLFSYLTNIDNLGSPLGGTVKTRIELDLDYQPRIIIDNLLISRQRWRFRKDDLCITYIAKRDMLSILKWMAESKIPSEFYIYTDLAPKPYYCRLGTSFDLVNFHSVVRTAKEFFYIEEVYPNYRSNERITPYNMEMLCKLCLN